MSCRAGNHYVSFWIFRKWIVHRRRAYPSPRPIRHWPFGGKVIHPLLVRYCWLYSFYIRWCHSSSQGLPVLPLLSGAVCKNREWLVRQVRRYGGWWNGRACEKEICGRELVNEIYYFFSEWLDTFLCVEQLYMWGRCERPLGNVRRVRLKVSGLTEIHIWWIGRISRAWKQKMDLCLEH